MPRPNVPKEVDKLADTLQKQGMSPEQAYKIAWSKHKKAKNKKKK